MHKYACRFILLILLIPAAGLLLGGSFGERVVSRCTADLNNDGVAETLRLEGGYGPFGKYLVITESGIEIMRFDLSDINPWKVQTADVDGDGKREVSLGVYTRARSDPELNKRLFLFRLTDKGLYPVWLGTRLSKPFEDYAFSDLDGDGRDELVAVEFLADGRKVLNIYKWKGFGFEGLCQGQGFQDIKELEAGSESGAKPSALATLDDGTRKRVALSYKEGVLILE